MGDDVSNKAARPAFELAVTRPRPYEPLDERRFGFGDPGRALRTLRATNGFFCVIADPQPLGPPLSSLDPDHQSFGNTLWMRDWLATAQVSGPPGEDGHASVLILKSCPGTLTDLLATPDRWTAPGHFSAASQEGVATLAGWARAEVADGIARADAGDRLYEEFARISQAEDWQGFLILRAPIGAGGMPAALACLTRDPEIGSLAFRYIWSEGFGAEWMPIGSVIDYLRPATEQPEEGPDGAGVPPAAALREMRGQFRNSALSSFRGGVAIPLGGATPLVLELHIRGMADGRYLLAPPEGGEVHALDRPGDDPRPLEAWMAPMFAGLWALRAPGEAGQETIRIEVSYQFGCGDGLASAIPMFLTPDVDMADISAGTMTEQMSASILAWLQAQAPSPHDAELRFDIRMEATDLLVDFPPISLGMAAVRAGSES